MDLEDFRQRVQAERRIRTQRDAAEKNIPLERLRREIREAFARERARDLGNDDRVAAQLISIRATGKR